jgi:proline iminopeptidase
MAFASRADLEGMNAAISAVPRGNRDFEAVAFGIEDYLVDFLNDSAGMRMPVLFFYGKRDWMIGPEHFKHVRFPNMMLWETNMEHMSPFLGNNRAELGRAVGAFADRYGM